MKLFKKKSPPKSKTTEISRTQALSCKPMHSPGVEWITDENGTIRLEYPIQLKPFFVQLTKRFQKGPEQRLTKKLDLDDVGSKVWLMMDGKRDVKNIIREVSKETELSLQEAEMSVTIFFKELGKRGLIYLE